MDLDNIEKIIKKHNLIPVIYYKGYADKLCLIRFSNFPKDIINEIYTFILYKAINYDDKIKRIKSIISDENDLEKTYENYKLKTYIYVILEVKVVWNPPYFLNNIEYCKKIMAESDPDNKDLKTIGYKKHLCKLIDNCKN